MFEVKYAITNLVVLVLLVSVLLATGYKMYGVAEYYGILSCVCVRTFTWDLTHPCRRHSWILLINCSM